MERESVDINGEKIVFFVQRKNIKNINLKVNIDKKVTMSIPMRMEIEIAKEFIKKNGILGSVEGKVGDVTGSS